MAQATDMTPAARHIFISFASQDLQLAHRVREQLERAGLRCWISDRDIEPAASYPAAITAAVKESGAFLLLLTPAANQSRHVLREIELAFNARRPILPLRIAGTTPSPDVQYFLSTSQWSDAGAEFDETDVAVVEPRLRELLQRGSDSQRGGQDEHDSWRRKAGMAVALGAGIVALLLFLSGRREGNPSPAIDTSPDVARPVEREPAASHVNKMKVNARDSQMYTWVPPGTFIMGCSSGDPDCADDEKPAHAVEITRGFWLAQTEVTNAQYRKAAASARAGTEAGMPVTRVSWKAAKDYCAAVGGRLPSEAEWEYAARGGIPARAYGSLSAIAWYEENSDGGPHPVGTKAPNAFGLHDMLGNVSEWVRDRYYNAYDDSSNPAEVVEPLTGNASGVARGGSFLSEADGIRASRRLEMTPDAEEPHVGFRCALDEP